MTSANTCPSESLSACFPYAPRGGPDLAGRAGGFGCTVQEDHQLKVLLGEGVGGQLVERTGLIDHVVEGQRTHKEQVVLASVNHEVNVHLIQDDGPTIRSGCGPQQLPIDLTSNQQGLSEMTAVLLKLTVFALFLGKEILARMTPHMKQLMKTPTRDWTMIRATVPAQWPVRARPPYPMVVWVSREYRNAVIPVGLCDPVPEQAEEEPAAREGGHKQQEDEAPADLHKGGPEVHQEGKVVAVLYVAELNVAVAILGDQAGLAASVSSGLVLTREQLEHCEAERGDRITDRAHWLASRERPGKLSVGVTPSFIEQPAGSAAEFLRVLTLEVSDRPEGEGGGGGGECQQGFFRQKHGLLTQNPPETEAAQVQRLEVPVQDELGHGPAHGGGVLQAVAAEARGKVHVVDGRVHADDGVLVKGEQDEQSRTDGQKNWAQLRDALGPGPRDTSTEAHRAGDRSCPTPASQRFPLRSRLNGTV
ncbi:unnamed protein product [Menidia menidia]|uniref:(Atlantic silverside) hypothetical protein n=1 Tax=Menidia menidia TaxID=238744 RepID=A0A8S4AI55_9TELE|nr:unnamed protein product [Menidia menidia]